MISKVISKIIDNDIVFDYEMQKKIKVFNSEIQQLFNFFSKKTSIIEAKNFIKQTNVLFKGTAGLGLNFFMFTKN